MGVWGPHSYDENDNEVKTYYRWDKGFQALNEVALVDLPMLTTAQANQIIDHFDKLAEEAGWVQEKRQDTGDAAVVYSITDASRFNTNRGGVNIDYDGLCAEFDIYGRELRCSTSFLGAADRDSKRLDHCAVDDNNRHGVVAVWVYGEQQLHFPASLAPPSLDQLPGLLKDLVATTPPSTFFAELDGALTQDSVAQIFAQRFKDQLRYCHHTGAWFRWADTHWQREQTALAFDICRKLSREISRGSGTNVMKEARKVGFAGGVERFAKADRAFAVTSEIWDRDPFLLGTPGGTVDLRTGVLRAADPADGITKLTAVTPADHADCPRWKRFLEETFGDDAELIRFIRQWCGYSLTGDIREEALVFGYGNGNNGKSVWLNTVAGILRDYAVVAPMETFVASKWDRHPTELAMLRGARLVTATETEEGRSWAEARIKQITGGDPISARFMQKDFFAFTPAFKLTVVGNHKPVLNHIDEAIRRRFNLIPFLRKPEVVDPQLKEKLKLEWPGILRWAIEGCLDWQASHGLVRPESVIKATQNYFSEQDSMGQWLKEACVVDRGNRRVFERVDSLFVSWCSFAFRAGEQPGSKKAFSSELNRQGFERDEQGDANVRVFRGLRLKQTAPNREELARQLAALEEQTDALKK